MSHFIYLLILSALAQNFEDNCYKMYIIREYDINLFHVF